jgi:trans-2,3-dihydro-3-hydroxyanthranilate isomerase
MGFDFSLVDVFTDRPFGGNRLAVFPDATGIADATMQQLAWEFNFSETTFVLPPEAGRDRRVRIFTPPREVPFAGHPNIGTAFVLASMGAFGALEAPRAIVFEEQAGLVPVTIEKRHGERIWCELTAPQGLTLGKTVSAQSVAAAVSLAADDILTTSHEPQVASVGLPFLIAELRDRDALERARPDISGLEGLIAEGIEQPDVHLYVRTSDGFDIRARMFSPMDGIPEDPATGSANCALVGLLSHLDKVAEGTFSWRIAQGVEMGRPSVLEARAEKRDGEVVHVWIGGESVMVAEGLIEV